MNRSIAMFREPDLEFRYGQKAKDPKTGLTLYGPYDADSSNRPSSMSYITLGPEDGIEKFRNWSQLMNLPSIEAPNNNTVLWKPFPGFAAAFSLSWPKEPAWAYSIDRSKLIEASKIGDPHTRAYEVVQLYLEGFKTAKKLDENIGVAVCIIPEEVWQNCRPESKVVKPVTPAIKKERIRSRKAGQRELFEKFDPEQYELSVDFRRQLKARTMEFGIPVQLIRETTLRLTDDSNPGERGLTPLSDRMWNLSSTLYYKCGGKPWKLASPREGVCYIGLAFRQVPSSDSQTACCAAQMFLNSGDGVVFLGEFGPWYSPKNRQFHLSPQAAQNLLSGVLETYRNLGGQELREIFLHSRSTLEEPELRGFAQACPEGVSLVAIRVRNEGDTVPRLYRIGRLPVVRGTFVKIAETSGLLFGSGFKPDLLTYDGSETPSPISIDIEYGNAPIERVAQDILGLTKLNYNACKLGDASPVTISFSDAVGEILISNPTIETRHPNFKFYI